MTQKEQLDIIMKFMHSPVSERDGFYQKLGGPLDKLPGFKYTHGVPLIHDKTREGLATRVRNISERFLTDWNWIHSIMGKLAEARPETMLLLSYQTMQDKEKTIEILINQIQKLQ